MNASPRPLHQLIATNVALKSLEREIKAPWTAMLPLGVRVSDKDRPEPDVPVFLPITAGPMRGATDDALVVFEVRSPSTEERGLGWTRKAYASLASPNTTP